MVPEFTAADFIKLELRNCEIYCFFLHSEVKQEYEGHPFQFCKKLTKESTQNTKNTISY